MAFEALYCLWIVSFALQSARERDGRGKISGTRFAGHTPGFTFYIFEDVLLICDYVFLKGDRAGLNPFGRAVETKEGFNKMMALIENRNLSTVCGYNYVIDFASWKQRVNAIP